MSGTCEPIGNGMFHVTWTCSECGRVGDYSVRHGDRVTCDAECGNLDVATFRDLPLGIGGVVDVRDPYGYVHRQRLYAVIRVDGRPL